MLSAEVFEVGVFHNYAPPHVTARVPSGDVHVTPITGLVGIHEGIVPFGIFRSLIMSYSPVKKGLDVPRNKAKVSKYIFFR